MQIETPQAVAIYCRLSNEDLDENKIDNLSRSIQNQKSMLTDFAKINGWQIFDIYCDDNLSGVARDRPEFNRLIRDASLRKFNIILCKNQSRFTRDMQLFFLRLLFLSSYPLSGKQKKKSLCYHKKRKGPCGPGKLKKPKVLANGQALSESELL